MSLKSRKKAENKGLERTALSPQIKSRQLWVTVFMLFVFLVGAIGFSPDKNEVLSRVISAAICAAMLYICLFAENRQKLYKAVNPLTISVCLYAFVYFVSTFWAASGKIALFEYIKPVTAMAGFIIALVYLMEQKDGVDKLIKWLSGGLAFLSFLSVDAASAGFFTYPLKAMTDGHYGFYEVGVRISSILNSPNVFAPMAAIGVFLSFYLISVSQNKKEKLFASVCFALNAAALILTFSLGALGMFALSALVFIFLLPKEKQAMDFLFAAAYIIASAAISALSFLFFGKSGILSFMPLALLALSCLAVFSLVLLSERLSGIKLKIKTGVMPLVAVAVVAVYLIAAFLITTPYNLKEGDILYRAFYPDAGEYELYVETDSDTALEIQLQDANQIYAHTYTSAYKGSISSGGDKVAFSVPEGTRIAKLYFNSSHAKLTKVQAIGDKTYDIKLGYPLLPSFAVTRLQGLFENQNAIQRFAFYKDGLKLFVKNPLTGVGAGGFWTRSMEIQEYYYESRYVHNHYIQTMTEAGIWGLFSFLSIVASSIYLVIRKIKKDGRSYLFALLFACLSMMFLHAVVEVDFSVNPFINLAFLIFAIVSVTCAGERKLEKCRKPSDFSVIVPAFVVSAVTFMVLIGNFTAYNMTNNLKTSKNPFNDLRICAVVDPYNGDTYRMAYVVNAANLQEPEPEIFRLYRKYEKQLSRSKSFEVLKQLETMYFNRGDIEQGFKTSLKYLKLVKKAPNMWQQEFDLYESIFSKDNIKNIERSMQIERAVNGVLSAYSQLKLGNENAAYKVTLSDKNLLFIMKILSAQNTGGTPAGLQNAVSRLVFDSTAMVDTDSDAQNDLISYDGGIESIAYDTNGKMTVKAPSAGNLKLKVSTEKADLVIIAIDCDNFDALSAVSLSGTALSKTENIAGQNVYYFENVEQANEIILSVNGDVTISSIVAAK